MGKSTVTSSRTSEASGSPRSEPVGHASPEPAINPERASPADDRGDRHDDPRPPRRRLPQERRPHHITLSVYGATAESYEAFTRSRGSFGRFIRGLDAAHEAGLHVPHDLSVVGFDDISLAAYATPPLTTVRQPIAALARIAATLLLDRITADAVAGRGDPQAWPGTLLVPELIVRRSAGPARADLKGGEIPA